MKMVADTIVMIVSSTANNLPTRSTSGSVRQRLEDEIRGRGPAFGHRHLLGLRAEPLLPGRDRVFPRRQARQAELAVGAAQGRMRRRKDRKVAVHPGMDVAL